MAKDSSGGFLLFIIVSFFIFALAFIWCFFINTCCGRDVLRFFCHTCCPWFARWWVQRRKSRYHPLHHGDDHPGNLSMDSLEEAVLGELDSRDDIALDSMELDTRNRGDSPSSLSEPSESGTTARLMSDLVVEVSIPEEENEEMDRTLA
ncbi:hypothetical protein IWQ62_000935 [Dispira parvispora]|uniref:Uncharacterized protein n=1 Tax=Dispira parvispora TaxID=1520584 RepID=A0A9W8E9M5_9FUNG|nr:hypothetical protein IWQ62_000935 [Dispira parvispora]